MINEKLYEIARKAWDQGFAGSSGSVLDSVVDAVAVAVRAECANICDELHWSWRWTDDTSGPKECAEAIRALNKQEPK